MSEILRPEFDATIQRLEDEDRRQNKRLDMLEASLSKLNDLTVTVGRMAISLETMTKQLERQAQQLTEIEKTPVSRWNTLIGAIIGALAAAAVAYLLR